MPGGVLEIIGILALLAGGCELGVRLAPRRSSAVPRISPEPEVDALRRTGAL